MPFRKNQMKEVEELHFEKYVASSDKGTLLSPARNHEVN